jgi:hypothetical protein
MTVTVISTSKLAVRKPYMKPTLAKGPVLADVTAQPFSPGPLTKCWVARAAFGERDIRWLIFRAWLMEDSSAWFRLIYLRYGAQVGKWLEGRDGARRLVRAAMMPAIKRKSSYKVG